MWGVSRLRLGVWWGLPAASMRGIVPRMMHDGCLCARCLQVGLREQAQQEQVRLVTAHRDRLQAELDEVSARFAEFRALVGGSTPDDLQPPVIGVPRTVELPSEDEPGSNTQWG